MRLYTGLRFAITSVRSQLTGQTTEAALEQLRQLERLVEPVLLMLANFLCFLCDAFGLSALNFNDAGTIAATETYMTLRNAGRERTLV